MEKRFLLALALSMAVFVVFSLLQQRMGGAPPAQPPLNVAAPAPVTTTAPRPTTEPTRFAPETMPAATLGDTATVATPAVTITVEKVTARFHGGSGFDKWVLHDYRVQPRKDSPNIDLAAAAAAQEHLRLSLWEGYRPGHFAIATTAPNAVTYTGSVGGVHETRAWSVHGYTATLTWRVRNETGRPILINPAIALLEGLNYKTMQRYAAHSPIIARGSEILRPDEEDVREKPTYTSVRWAGMDDKYFLRVALPPEGQSFDVFVHAIPTRVTDVTLVSVDMRVPATTLGANEEWLTTLRFYFGPKSMPELKAQGVGLEASVNFGFFGFLARPLLVLLKLFHSFLGNYGLAIILVTLLVKLLFYPLSKKSLQAMRRMQEIQPKMEAIRTKYAKDPQRMQQEMMNLYRTEGINPFGGCLPILVQIPVFVALYEVLFNAIELRHAPFVFWINDLSAPEDLFTLHLLGLALPFRLLPLIMGITMVIQQRMTPSTMDKTQQQIMMIMPIVFTVFLWGFPSGLVLYWLVNNLLTIAQQWFLQRGVKRTV